MFGETHMLAQFMDFTGTFLGLVLEYFLKPFSRFHWPYLLTSLVFALLAWFIYEAREPAGKRKGLIQFLFPKSVWLHKSAILDYKYVFVDKLIIGFLGAAAAVVTGKALAKGNHEAMLGSAAGDSLTVAVFYTICLLLTEDMFRYWMHRLMHKVPLLWEFHKVHHSPEVLVPFSLLRTHPVNGLLNLARTGAAIVLVTGIFLLIFPEKLSPITIFGINIGRVLFNVCGAHLRHSHIWLGFGPVLSRIFISPSMHQIHHSAHTHHWDRNFGSQFAIWDWLFGTLYIPKAEERHSMKLGLGGDDYTEYRSVKDLYFIPFKQAWQRLKQRRAWNWAV
ncbi:MAG TPA: sterol desaturase family protein [Sphingomonadales bacterium]